ncbi:MAG: glucose-6-phosphate isomerase [Verrucomicrobia bacterium]|nr:glucose-6-phosphate isomerase [Verrucomicrobiota bacterium]
MVGVTLKKSIFAQGSYSFETSAAFKKLSQLSKTPYDLTQEGHLTPERIHRFVAHSTNWKLLYGTQRVDAEVMETLQQLAREANVFEKMHAMQGGEVINCIEGFESEQRRVLHTALRDFFDHPNEAKEAREAAKAAKRELEKLETLIYEIDKEERWTDLLFVGIGGSELGPKMLVLGLEAYQRPNRRVHFISNVDPDDVASVLKGVDLEHALLVTVSKSGGTLETKTNEDFVRRRFEEAGLDVNEHCIAVTGEGSPMDDPARYRQCLYIWDWVGGRYSGTSVVGGIALAFAYGLDLFRDLLRGAHAMDLAAREEDFSKNIPLLMALLGIWNRNFLHFPTLAIIPYCKMLGRLSAHVQQLDMESNGKRIDRFGKSVSYSTSPVIWGEPATNAQHSFFQMMHQGTDVVPFEFIGFKRSQMGQDMELFGTTCHDKLVANLFAQALALAQGQTSSNPNKFFPGNRPSSILLAEVLDPYTLGALLSIYEHKVAFQGFIWNINSFDQEGVQLGKVLANKVLNRIAGGKEPYLLGDAFLDELQQCD